MTQAIVRQELTFEDFLELDLGRVVNWLVFLTEPGF